MNPIFSLINAIRYSSCRLTLCLRCYSLHLVESFYSNAHVPFPDLIQWNYTIISNISCWKKVNQNQNLCTILYGMKILGFLFYWMCFKHRKIISRFDSYLQMPPEAAIIHTHASVSHYSQSEHRKQQLISQSERAGDSQSGSTTYNISLSESGQSSSVSQSEHWVCSVSQSGLGVSINAISN